MKDTLNKEMVTLYLEQLDKAIKSDIDDINDFDRSDILRLEKDMLLNLRNLKRYDAKILRLNRKLESMYENEERLSRQVNYTKDIIIDDMEYEITKSIAVIIVYAMISSNNFQEFIKKVIILLLLDALTFKVNMDYFTSDSRRVFVEKRLNKLRSSIANQQLIYELYRGINKCCTLKLDIQYDKLLELYPEIERDKIKVRK